MTTKGSSHDPPWVEAIATVSTCKYRFGSLSAMAFGVPDRDHFLITFTYRAGSDTHTGTLTSPVAIPQGDTFPIAYNPLGPKQIRRSTSSS